MVPEKMVDLDQIIASSPVIVLWGEPLEHRPVDFITSNVGQFGYTVPEMVLEEIPYSSFVYEGDWSRVAFEFADALKIGRNSFVSDYRIVTRSGDIRWVEDRIVFHRDTEGKAVLYQSNLLDITERKSAEMRLRESEERLARVLNAAHVGVWEYFPEKDEIIGPGRAPIFGMNEKQLPESRKELWDSIIPLSLRSTLEAVWNGIVEGRSKVLDFEHRILRADGSEGWILTKGFPVRNEGGTLLSMQGVTVDVTHLKQAEEKVIRQNERLALLHDMSLAFMEELDTGVLIRRILEKATELAGSTHGLLAVIDEEGSLISNMWGIGLYEGLVGNVNPVSTGLLGQVLKENKRIIVEDYRVFPGRMNLDAYRDVTTVIGIPLHRGGVRLGAIAIAFTGKIHVLEESLLVLLDQCAAAASIALENARLYEASYRELEERKKAERRLLFHQTLVEAAAEGASFLLSLESGDKAMFFALRSLGDAVDADRVALFRNRADPDDGLTAEVWSRTSLSEGCGDFVLPVRLFWEKDFRALLPALAQGKPFHGPVASVDAHEEVFASFDSAVTLTMIPVFIRSRFWGVLAFCFKEERVAFETDEIDVLRAAAYNMAASVIRWESEHDVKEGYEKLRKTFSDVIRTMGQVVGKKDPYTIEHQERVAVLAAEIGARMGLEPERYEGIRIAGLVHDVGKIEVPGEILSKPGRLSMIEFELIKTHASSGYEILREVDFPWPVAEITRQHHERLDGSGYPRGLKGDEILLEARILSVADVVESMVSHRPYRPSLGMNAAREEISSRRGELYDPEVVDACLSLLDERPDIIAEQ